MKFTLGAEELIFERGGRYPVSKPLEKMQAIDYAAGGRIIVENLGPDKERREIVFKSMSDADYLGLKNWYYNVANGAENPFEFTDEFEFVGTVQFISPTFNFPMTSYNRHGGSLTVEYV